MNIKNSGSKQKEVIQNLRYEFLYNEHHIESVLDPRLMMLTFFSEALNMLSPLYLKHYYSILNLTTSADLFHSERNFLSPLLYSRLLPFSTNTLTSQSPVIKSIMLMCLWIFPDLRIYTLFCLPMDFHNGFQLNERTRKIHIQNFLSINIRKFYAV